MRWYDFCVIIFLLFPAVMLTASAQALAMEAPDTLKEIYMKDGRVIECQLAWIDGNYAKCKTRKGDVGFPLSAVDLEKTYWNAGQAETKGMVVTKSTSISQHGDILLHGFRVLRVLVQRQGSDQTAKRGTYHEISCCVENHGKLCGIAVKFAAIRADGVLVREEILKTKSALATKTSEIISRKAWLIQDDDFKIAEWKVASVSVSDK